MAKKLKRISINSEEDLRAKAVTILRRIEDDELGGLLFLLNPIIALEETGFDLNPAMRRHISYGLRYGASTKIRMRELESEVTELAGHEVNVASDAQVSRLLFEELKLSIPTIKLKTKRQVQTSAEPTIYERVIEPDTEKGRGAEEVDYTTKSIRELRTLVKQRGLAISGNKRELVARLEEDDRITSQKPAINPELLEALRDKHPVVPKIIEIRELLQTGWRLVNRETYDKVKNGATVTLLRSVHFRHRSNDSDECHSERGNPCR
jgi:hypothetical protein